MIWTIIWAILGWVVGYVVNQISDYLPKARFAATMPSFELGVPGIWGIFGQNQGRRRPLILEVSAIILFTALPSLIPNRINLIVNSFHIAVLLLIIVIDLENRLIFDIVTYPATILAVIGSLFVTSDENSLLLSLAGAAAGLVAFWLLYKIAQLAYGAESGALGAGDVKLAMLMGAMLGFHRIFFALFLGMILGGVISFLLLISRRVNRETALPYGQYLAAAAIIMLIWGAAYAEQYLN